jgi:type IV secretory pathway VirB9-like protein
MKTTMILASTAAALAFATPAFAGSHSEAEMKTHFEQADTNKDGALDANEWNAKAAEKSKEMWDKVDANKDGKVTFEEKKAAHAKWKEEKHD